VNSASVRNKLLRVAQENKNGLNPWFWCTD